MSLRQPALPMFGQSQPARFDGVAYEPSRDDSRLSVQYRRIFALMADGAWRTLAQIEASTGDPPASISAQLRHMRKLRFGAHTVNRRYLGQGLYEYQLVRAAEISTIDGAEERANAQLPLTTPARAKGGRADMADRQFTRFSQSNAKPV